MRTGAIVVAAGSSQRMGGADKLLLALGGRPVLAHSLATFAAHPRIDALAVVVSEANEAPIRALATQYAPTAQVVLGGPRRRDSVLNGLEALPDCDYVLVHDGARPLVKPELVDAALDGAIESGASLCAVPVSDTVKRADDAGFVRGTISRQGLWLAQTPQAFRRDTLRRAHASSDIDVTDDCALVELLGEPVRVVMGSQRNLKITTAADLALAEALLAAGDGN
ncbi:MAG TPA: 2-C-methyl-D-erythritol 4-phosphate cytidylyltransferase [Dehalococcoidia bacterium]|nr:2-C-methyl-D-erythritol 4-phosphate cytidylyltransferase [Dehalococcoidia bacterium]